VALWRCGGGLPAQELVEHGLVRGWPLGRYGSWWCGLPALLCAGARRWPVGWVAASREQSGGMGMRGRGMLPGWEGECLSGWRWVGIIYLRL